MVGVFLGGVGVEVVELIVEQANAALALEDPWEGIRTFLERYFEQQAADRGLREYLLGHRGGTELARRARGRVLPVVSALVAQAHAAGRLHPDIGASDFAVIPLLINPVVGASEGASPDLWCRWLAIVLEGIASGPRTKTLPRTCPRRRPRRGDHRQEALSAPHPAIAFAT